MDKNPVWCSASFWLRASCKHSIVFLLLQSTVLKESAEERARLGTLGAAARSRGGPAAAPAAPGAPAAAAAGAAKQKPLSEEYAELLGSIP